MGTWIELCILLLCENCTNLNYVELVHRVFQVYCILLLFCLFILVILESLILKLQLKTLIYLLKKIIAISSRTIFFKPLKNRMYFFFFFFLESHCLYPCWSASLASFCLLGGHCSRSAQGYAPPGGLLSVASQGHVSSPCFPLSLPAQTPAQTTSSWAAWGISIISPGGDRGPTFLVMLTVPSDICISNRLT